MEELEYKLKTGNSVLIVNAISKLVETIKNNQLNKTSKSDECSELRILREKCEAVEPIICLTACQGLVRLVEEGVLDVSSTLTSLISILSNVSNFTGIISALGSLLVMDLKSRVSAGKSDTQYVNPFNLRSPQHPFITVMTQKQNIWFDVINQMQCICNHQDNQVSEHSLELLRPTFLYVLCNPKPVLEDNCKQQAWSLLVKLSYRKDARLILMEGLAWSQITSPRNCLSTSLLCVELIDKSILVKDTTFYNALTPYLVSLVHNLIQHGYDPRTCFSTILQVLQTSENCSYGSLILMLLADTITICPAVYLSDLIRICNEIVKKQNVNYVSIYMVVSSILQWMAYPSYLTMDVLTAATDIIKFARSYQIRGINIAENSTAEKLFDNVKNFDSRLMKYFELSTLADNFQSHTEFISSWVEQLIETKNFKFIYDIKQFLFGIFTSDLCSKIRLRVLEMLLKCTKIENKLAVGLLTLILYKLSSETDPTVQLQLLRALPEMAVVKENISLVVHTIECFKKGSYSLRTLSIDLHIRLWRIEVRCYPYLQSILVEEPRENDITWEMDIAKATAIKEICETRPEHHGTELVAHLSNLLNRCGDAAGSIASALAITSIASLCKAGVVDIVSTWKALAPRLSKDKRPAVIVSLCHLFGEVPGLRCPTMEFEKLIVELVDKLWSYVINYDNKEIISAALRALSMYSLDQIALRQLPNIFRQNIKLPSAYAKTPAEAARKPEDVLPYIPGECWVQLLKNINHSALDEAGNLLSTWIKTEILQYRSGIYHVSQGRGEPSNYNILPDKSVVRAVTEFVISQASGQNFDCPNIVLLQCLKILSNSYSKPLPPLNWCFLHEIFHKGTEQHNLCVTIATKQILISGTAKRFVENYLSTFDPVNHSHEEILNIFENLPDLSKGVPPNMLRPVIDKSLNLALQKERIPLLFTDIMLHIKTTLQNNDIHDANRTLLSQFMENLFDKIEEHESIFEVYADCCIELSSKYIERMTAPSTWWEITESKLRKAIIIRCLIATSSTTETPLVWLNEIIDASLDIPSLHKYVMTKISTVLFECRCSNSSSQWCLELMGQIQAKLAEAKSKSPCSLIFLCDVFVLSIVLFSGCQNLLEPLSSRESPEERLKVFPIAIYTLCLMDGWDMTNTQVMEWLYHMVHTPLVPLKYAVTFQRSLFLLKNNKHFEKPNVWMRNVNLRIISN